MIFWEDDHVQADGDELEWLEKNIPGLVRSNKRVQIFDGPWMVVVVMKWYENFKSFDSHVR